MHYLNDTDDEKLVRHHRQKARQFGNFSYRYHHESVASSDQDCRLIEIKGNCERSSTVASAQPFRTTLPQFIFFCVGHV